MIRSLLRPLLLGALLLAPLLLAPAAASAQTPAAHQLVQDNAEELGIDQATLDMIQQISTEGYEEMRRLRHAKRAARAELEQLLLVDEPDRAAVMAQVERVGQAEVELMQHQLVVLMDIRELLTEEQREAITELVPTTAPVGSRRLPRGE